MALITIKQTNNQTLFLLIDHLCSKRLFLNTAFLTIVWSLTLHLQPVSMTAMFMRPTTTIGEVYLMLLNIIDLREVDVPRHSV